MNDRFTQDLTETIKLKMKKELNDIYTQFKEDYLEMLETSMEAKRNHIINSVLDGIKIYVDNNSPLDAPNTYNINIRLENKIIMKEK